jgi:hypothetical protein
MDLTPEQRFDFRQNLFHDLRNELGHLKTCQTTVFLIGITGSGIFLGLVGLKGFETYLSVLLLMPLVILLPLWIIFYDKARTISRIVGFLRVQEILALENSEDGLKGWESSMSEYWKIRDQYDDHKYDRIFEAEIKSRRNENDQEENYKIREKLFNSTYWMTIYVLFFTFSMICLGMSFYSVEGLDAQKRILLVWFFLTFILIFYEVATRKILHTWFKKVKHFDPPPHSKFYFILLDIFYLAFICGLITLFLMTITNIIFLYIGLIILILFVILYSFNKLVLNYEPCERKEGNLNLAPCKEKEQCTKKGRIFNLEPCVKKDILIIIFLFILGVSISLFFIFYTNDFLKLGYEIKYTILYLIFGSLFIGVSALVFWMLQNLIKGYRGRYSYSSFQLRWEITLRKEEFVKNRLKIS